MNKKNTLNIHWCYITNWRQNNKRV